MGATERIRDRAVRRVRQVTIGLGHDLRETRLSAGLSQQDVAVAAGVSRTWYTELEAGKIRSPGLAELATVAAVLGLDLVTRFYPGGQPLRDQAQARRLGALLEHAAAPLRARRETPLPAREGALEQRAWDAVIVGGGLRTCVEVEMRIRDAQALERRLALKRRDDPPDRFVLVLADTTMNRKVLRENPGVFTDLSRLRPSRVLADLEGGRHPPTGIILL